MGKVPLQVLKKLEHQARQNLATTKFTAIKTVSACKTTMEKCQHSLKATFKRVPILKKLPGVAMKMPVTILRL